MKCIGCIRGDGFTREMQPEERWGNMWKWQHASQPKNPPALAARLQYVEKELALAQATIQQLQETAQHKAEALHSTEAQLLLYASDLHHAYRWSVPAPAN